MEEELNTLTSPLIDFTPLKSNAATSLPVMVIEPSKVGQEFNWEMAVAAVKVVDKEHELEEVELAAEATAAKRVKRTDGENIGNGASERKVVEEQNPRVDFIQTREALGENLSCI